jgi:hypothetical protein
VEKRARGAPIVSKPAQHVAKGARAGAVALAAVAVVLTTAALAPGAVAAAGPRACDVRERTYGWPVRPFAEQHLIRGTLNEPRNRSFHFGVDIFAPDGEPVYAVAAGIARVPDRTKLAVVAGPCVTYQFWHVIPSVADAARVRRGQLIGRILTPYGHVHLGEYDAGRGRYLDPLRRGAGGLRPYRDRIRPVIERITLERRGRLVAPAGVRGAIDLVVRAYDPIVPPPPEPWRHFRLAPATVWSRLVTTTGRPIRRWRLALHNRTKIDDRRYPQVYAPGSRVNERGGRVGVYRYWLARGLDTRRLGPGRYVAQTRVADAQGNAMRASLSFTVGRASPRKQAGPRRAPLQALGDSPGFAEALSPLRWLGDSP